MKIKYLEQENAVNGDGMNPEKEGAFYTALEDTYGARNYLPLDVVISRADGVWVYDVEGNKYLDCLSAYSAVCQGHCHPAIRQAI